MLKKLFFIMGSIFVANNIYADSTYVYCVTKDKQWNWLKENGNYVSVNGEWRPSRINKKTELNSIIIYYFKIIDDTKSEELQRQCIKNLGASYIYAQAANNYANYWYVFGVDGKNLSNGFKTQFHFSSTYMDNFRIEEGSR